MTSLPLDTLTAYANAYCAAHGLQVESAASTANYQTAPLSLLPNPYPATAFANAQKLAPLFNELVELVSRDAAFLEETLGGAVADSDPFTAHLLTLYKDIYIQRKNEHALAADRLGIFRSDYMLQNGQVKQIELNTVAASFASLSTQVAGFHRFILERCAHDPGVAGFIKEQASKVLRGANAEEKPIVPENSALERLPLAMKTVVERYRQRFNTDKQLCVLFVVQDSERNTVDQRLLEFRLWTDHKIPVLRRSLTALHTELQEENGFLMLKDGTTEYEVALVYFRAGYAPTDYGDMTLSCPEWMARRRLEESRATKCPCLSYHLAGTKKVQQALARPGVVERYAPAEAATALRQAFAGLYSLEDVTNQDLAVVKSILKDATEAEKYVLKPQREGGGYNFYGKHLLEKVKAHVTVDGDEVKLGRELGEYILMERLFPPEQTAVLLRAGKVEGTGETVSELGIYGTYLVAGDDNNKELWNEYAGFLLRTKFANVDEGGVASGFATLSSPYLC